MDKITDIENIVSNKIVKHNNNHKNKTYTEEEYNNISGEFMKSIEDIKTNEDIKNPSPSWSKYMEHNTQKINSDAPRFRGNGRAANKLSPGI